MSYDEAASAAWRQEVHLASGEDLVFLQEHYFDKAFLGVSFEGLVTYDAQKIVDVLAEVNDWNHEDAHEYAEYNIFTSYGEFSPIYIWPIKRHPELTHH